MPAAVTNVSASATSNSASNESAAAKILSGTQLALNNTLKASFGNGNAAAELIDIQYVNTLTLAAAATTLDLTNLLDPFGVAINFAVVRRIRIRPKTTTDGQLLTLSGGASNPWTAFMGGTNPTTKV